MKESLVDKVARAIYETHKFVRSWDDPKTQAMHGSHTRISARAAIKAVDRARKTP